MRAPCRSSCLAGISFTLPAPPGSGACSGKRVLLSSLKVKTWLVTRSRRCPMCNRREPRDFAPGRIAPSAHRARDVELKLPALPREAEASCFLLVPLVPRSGSRRGVTSISGVPPLIEGLNLIRPRDPRRIHADGTRRSAPRRPADPSSFAAPAASS